MVWFQFQNSCTCNCYR